LEKSSSNKVKITEKKNMFRYSVITLIVIVWNFFLIINSQHLPLCESLNDIQGNEKNSSEVKSRRIRALCDAIYSSRTVADHNELDSIPDFDLTQINSGRDLFRELIDRS
jgi:hypothetical protein